MDILIDIILKAGRSAVELSLFILLPVMVVMLSLMRLLEARGRFQAGARARIGARRAMHFGERVVELELSLVNVDTGELAIAASPGIV